MELLIMLIYMFTLILTFAIPLWFLLRIRQVTKAFGLFKALYYQLYIISGLAFFRAMLCKLVVYDPGTISPFGRSIFEQSMEDMKIETISKMHSLFMNEVWLGVGLLLFALFFQYIAKNRERKDTLALQ